MWPREVPIEGKPARTYKYIPDYHKWLSISEIPKLCLYVHPGAIMQEQDVNFIRENFLNTEFVDVGDGIHFIQEDNPHGIGEAISNWYDKIHKTD